MSQQPKRDIAEFFRPYAKPITPKKRRTPDLDHGTPNKQSRSTSPFTPSTARSTTTLPFDHNGRTPSRSDRPPLTTPKSGRSVSIPIHSPAVVPSLKLRPAEASTRTTQSVKQSAALPENSSSLSFSELPTSSRSIVEDGKLVGVRDSDSDDSLEDLAVIFGKKRNKGEGLQSSQMTGSANDDDNNEAQRRALLSQFTGGRSEPILKKETLRELQRRQKATKVDLKLLFEDERKEAMIRQTLAEADDQLERAKQEAEAAKKAELDKRMLAAILQGDSPGNELEDADRLVEALERTEALTGEKTFSFFGRTGPRDLKKAKRIKKRFPSASIPHSLWHAQDAVARERAFQSGIMTELASSAKLADDVVRWSFDSVLTEENDVLQDSYLQCVAASSDSWTRANVTPEDVQSTFETLGANATTLSPSTIIESHPQAKREMNVLRSRNYKYLLVTLKKFNVICQDMDFATLSVLTSTVCKLCLDQEIMLDNHVCQSTERLLAKLITLPDRDARDHVHQRLVSDIGEHVQEPALQAQLIQHMPASCEVTASLRTRLAARFFLGASVIIQFIQPGHENTPLSVLIGHLNTHPLLTLDKKASSLNSSSSYMNLSALITLLDISIADGQPPSHIRTDKDAESTFNASVDILADHIHALFVSIADTGASHMRRTEAKEALHSLHFRLVHVVRTQPRQKRHIFDSRGDFVERGGKVKRRAMFADALEIEQEGKGRDFMAKFLAKRKAIRYHEEDDVTSRVVDF